jgi:hypothetical protein
MKKIYIGEYDKTKIVNEYISENKIDKVYIIGDDISIDFENKENIKFSDTIMYKYFYRLLQEINKDSLIVLNECLKKQNRYDLTYNCIRRYMLQTDHRLIFNYFPIVKEQEDFMILYDMLQNNPFLKEPYKYITEFENVEVSKVVFDVNKTDVVLPDECEAEYEREKENLIGKVNKDPDIIPRGLLRFSEKKKPKNYDSLAKIKPVMNVAVSQLKVDTYYYNELLNFRKELTDVLQKIHG